jgi:tripartite-type tricarboxylate transporter receptor subunit TctC
LVILPILMKGIPYNAERDFVAVSMISRGTYGIAVHPDVPAKTLGELIALAKASPGKYSYATAGIGSGPHLACELLKSMANFDMIHVPYRGSAPALNDVLSGTVPVSFDNIVSQTPLVEAGKLRMLGVSSVQRAKLLPDAPTIGETVAGYEVGALGCVVVRSGTPRPIIDRLNNEIRAVLQEPAYADQAAKDGTTVIGSTVEEAERILRAESARWKDVIEKAGIKLE